MLLSLVLAIYGAKILIVLKASTAETTDKTQIAYRNISILMIFTVIGFIILSLCIGYDLDTDKTLASVSSPASICLSTLPPYYYFFLS